MDRSLAVRVENIVGLKPTLGSCFARRDYSDLSSTGHGWADGPHRDRRCDSAKRIAVALRSRDWAPLPIDYTQFLRRGALQGARIGRDVRFFDYSYYGSGIPGDAGTVGVCKSRVERDGKPRCDGRGPDTGDVFAYNDDEFTALCTSLKRKSRITSQRSRTQTCARWPI